MNLLNSIWIALTTRGPVGFFRNLLYIASNYQGDLRLIVGGVDSCRERAETAERYVRKATKVHVDVGLTADSFTKVIVIGHYRGKDHVQVFSLRAGSIDMLIDQLRDMQRYAEIERIDGPIEVSATMKRALII